MSLSRIWLVFALSTLHLPEVCAAGAEKIVRVGEGLLKGKCNEDGICSFKGIPYAAPPIGDLRWRPPQLPHSWTGTRDATKYGSKCLQQNDNGTWAGDESCLFLNVWTPASSCVDASCAVMFWIHGGAYVAGSGNEMYDGTKLAALGRNVVVVSINYRLGVMGFAGADALRDRDERRSTGNYGIQDQRQAMEWVQRNIHRFGGDNNNVMIFGESAGGGSVSMHLVMQKSWPSYHKAVIESGSFSYWSAVPMWEAAQQYDDLVMTSGCEGDEPLKCLLTMDARKLATVSMHLPARERPYGCPYAPVADGVELERLPWELLSLGKYNSGVPMMLGFNADEGTIGIAANPGFAKGFNLTEDDIELLLQNSYEQFNQANVQDALRQYKVGSSKEYTNWYWSATHFAGDYGFSCPTRRTAKIFGEHGQTVYQYYFSHTPRALPPSFAGIAGINGSGGCYHAAELQFVWQVTGDSKNFPALIGSDERLLAKTMAAYWVNFATHSDPNAGAARTELTISWPELSDGEAVLRFDLPHLSVEHALRAQQCKYIDSLGVLTPRLQEVSQQIQANLPHRDEVSAVESLLV